MDTEELKQDIILFFESIEKYYGCKTEITEGIFTDIDDIEAKNTTWNLSEFSLIRSAYRNSGNKFMLEGNGLYYEIDAQRITSFTKTGRHKVEFIEQYSETVFRITKMRFHNKY